MNARRIAEGWKTIYQQPFYPPETFMRNERFPSTCYKANNWIYVGQTKGTSKRGHDHLVHGLIKDVYIAITEEAKAWVINIACKKPTDFNYASEMWTLSALAKHVTRCAPASGYDCLKKTAKATIQKILDGHPIRPHKNA